MARDSEGTLAFAKMQNIASPFARAQEAYGRMMSGGARFRVVLDVTA